MYGVIKKDNTCVWGTYEMCFVQLWDISVLLFFQVCNQDSSNRLLQVLTIFNRSACNLYSGDLTPFFVDCFYV
jgi:hypothetical protein